MDKKRQRLNATQSRHPKRASVLGAAVAVVVIGVLCMRGARAEPTGKPVSEPWQRAVGDIAWVDYAPTVSNPDRGIPPTTESIRADLRSLQEAGFTGLVTYACGGLFGREVVATAPAMGFRGVILGVWDPTNESEVDAAVELGARDIVLGICVGNEGYRRRYTPEQLQVAMNRVRRATGKPVTTTEEIGDYEAFEELTELGDWVFPNAHPFFNGRRTPAAAIRWTRGAFDELSRRSPRFVWFKEVGLPTGGAEPVVLTEASQAEYYAGLAATSVRFAYFEAFDQTWKNSRPFEQRWGMFHADRTPKLLARQLLKQKPRLLRGADLPAKPQLEGASDRQRSKRPPFVVYSDGGSVENHFSPSGVDGDCGDIKVDEHSADRPHMGSSCLRIQYLARGDGPHKCAYAPPCKWASLRWLHPRRNWGIAKENQGRGFDLSDHRLLTFWARAENTCRLKFLVGGLDAPFGDSLAYPRSKTVQLTQEWQKFTIDLEGADLHHIIAGFGWETNWEMNPSGFVVYLDQIQFE